jgi:type IV pilus assembly protein PilO
MAKKLELKLTKEQQQMIVASVLMSIAFGYSYFTYFWKPTAEKIQKLNQQLEQSDRDIAEARRQAARLPQLRAQIEELQAQAEAAEKKLPKSKEVPELLETLNDLARQYGITIISFSPGKPAGQQYFIEIPYQMMIRGGYHQVARFLTSLALQERIFHSRALSLSPVKSTIPTETVTGSFMLVAFQFKG